MALLETNWAVSAFDFEVTEKLTFLRPLSDAGLRVKATAAVAAVVALRASRPLLAGAFALVRWDSFQWLFTACRAILVPRW